jgi:hypothetical protein
MVTLLARIGCVLAGLGFGSLVLHAPSVLETWIGEAEPLSLTVLSLYSVAWTLNVPAHVLVLAAFAADRHRVLAPIVLAEALTSFLLSILGAALSPAGPAAATLITLSVSNIAIVPALLLRRLGMRRLPFAKAALEGYVLGIVCAVLVWVVIEPLGLSAPGRAATAGLATGLVAIALVPLVLRGPLASRRLIALVADGGWRVVLRERQERIDAARRLEDERRAVPDLWLQDPDPLVTVRIATFDRGALVAERAIASALAQTYRNLEVLVVGDACDAATEAAVRSVRDPRVRFENLPQRGAYPPEAYRRWMVAGAAPMNRALQLARGSWIAPLDDDDEFTLDHIDVLLDACRRSQAEFAYGIAESEVAPDRWAPVGAWPPGPGRIVHAAVLYSRRLTFFPHSMDSWRILEPADWNLWRRMRAAGVRMVFVDRVVCRHYLERRQARPT